MVVGVSGNDWSADSPAPVVILTPAEARDYATALRLHVDPHASVAQREHAAVRVRELLRRLSAVGTP